MHYRVGRQEQLQPGMRFLVGEPCAPVAVFVLDDGTIRAIDDACPHHGASLAYAPVCGDQVVCPWHDWRISLATGQAMRFVGSDQPDRSHTVSTDAEGWVWVTVRTPSSN